MSSPHRASAAATGAGLILAAALLGALAWLATSALKRIRQPRRWPKPPRSWLRDFRAEAEERRKNGGRS